MNLGRIKVKTDERLPKMDQWVFQPHGRYLLSAERDALATVLPKLFGYYLLQLGGPVDFDLTDSSAIDTKIRLTIDESPGFDGASVRGQPNALPFQPDSIDVVLMPHVLDYLTQPEHILKSVYDVLLPEGTVIILGINPMSLWGLAKMCVSNSLVYRRAQLHTKSRVIRLLKAQGFQIIKRKTTCFRWPSSTEKALKRNVIMEPFGQLITPTFGGVYMIVARKRVEKMITIQSDLELRVINKAAQPTT